MAKLTSDGEFLYIDGKKVLKGWESFSGWFWFGYVQGLDEEWGYFSQAEIESLKPKTWEIPQENLSWSGRRDKPRFIPLVKK